MITVVLDVPTPERMRDLGRALGRSAQAGDRLMLEGPFGAGKTTFVQGLANGLDVATPVSSPSFVIEHQHHGRLILYHIDLYRLDSIEPGLLEQLEDHLFDEGVAAVEWPERLPAHLRAGATELRFSEATRARRVELTSTDERLAAAARAA